MEFIQRVGEKRWNARLAEMIICNELNKYNNTGARMIDSIYHMTLKLIKNCIFGVKTSRFSTFYAIAAVNH